MKAKNLKKLLFEYDCNDKFHISLLQNHHIKLTVEIYKGFSMCDKIIDIH